MRNKQLPLIEEAPLIVVGLAMVTIGAVAYAAVLGTTRAVMHLTGMDHRPSATH